MAVDEADTMFEKDFGEQVRKLVNIIKVNCCLTVQLIFIEKYRESTVHVNQCDYSEITQQNGTS